MKSNYRIKINGKGSSIIWDRHVTVAELKQLLADRWPGYTIEVIE